MSWRWLKTPTYIGACLPSPESRRDATVMAAGWMSSDAPLPPPPLKTEEDYIPYPSVHEVLGRRSPFPLILLPQFGGYWIEGTNHEPSSGPAPEQPPGPASQVKLETNSTAKIYRKHFMGKEHFNYYSMDTALGHLVFSLKYDVIGDQEHLRLVLRTKLKTFHDVIPISCLTEFPNVVQMAKLVYEEVNVDRFYPVLYPKASRLIVTFDEHVISNNFKFGVIYQKFGQVSRATGIYQKFGHVSSGEGQGEEAGVDRGVNSNLAVRAPVTSIRLCLSSVSWV
ncbi:rap1 GTPase-activating protein 1-like isoform X2 [Hypomesus transpacificus]|uniref:rap1 GTPase-activating protein 1-like isoform X2 n=1 Tax=Hypomesus transpacificus TaxID=137520 RepID=UPI001F085D8E|nr:rap1 GTPase-activating protein 1-like isoform X2 [Hypomesus transpacificus]